ncbi:hypothetical protein ACP275_02G118400 [Erythranthe tilingii]
MRPRTRRQWDEHYKNWFNEKKRANGESSSGGFSKRPRDERVGNAIDSEEPINNYMDQDFIIIGEKNSTQDNYVGSSEKRSSRRRTRNSASFDRGGNKIDTNNDTDENDDVVEYLGGNIFSSGSSSKFGLELDNNKNADLGHSSDSSDNSDHKSLDLSLSEDDDGESESESSDEESESESFDEDYKVDKVPSSAESNYDTEDDGVIIIEQETKSPDKESEPEQKSDRHNKKSARNRKKEDVVIINDDDEKRNIGARLSRIRKPRLINTSNEVDEISNDGGLKKRKALILEDSDKGNGKDDATTSVKHLFRPRPVSKCPNNECFESGKSWSKWGPLCSEKVAKIGKKRRNIELVNILVESINLFKEQKSPIEESGFAAQERLPMRFRFEDEVEPTVEKSEWEKEMDSLFHDLELGLRGFEIDHVSSKTENDDVGEIDTNPAACCRRGEHQLILEDEIGIVCKYCVAVILDIKYVLPPFYTPPSRKRDRREYSDEYSEEYSPNSKTDRKIRFQDSAYKEAAPDSIGTRGTVWDLIPGVENEMYPHQREGFEFIWRNIAGGTSLRNLQQPLTDTGGKGCIISHAPGTGKTRLTIVFLATFLKLYPNCRPVIIAPKGMLLTWESEFVKWKVNIPFHNMNKEELSENENEFAAKICAQLGGGGISKEHIRWVKLCKWMQGRSILGISYQLFEKLVGKKIQKDDKNKNKNENKNKNKNKNENEDEKMREFLLEYPGLLVLDEGHTPRNQQSLIWKALTKVSTKRCIILSGTPFQNNLTELYNTLCLVNPSIANQGNWCGNSKKTRGRPPKSADRKEWTDLGKNTDDGLKKLKMMLDPFVHVHKGTILEESLPGLRDTIVFLHPTELQKNLLETSAQERCIFHRTRLVSMVSVHPSLFPEKRRSVAQKNVLEEIESDIEAGVKLKFVMKLIYLADALGERVLIFSQYIHPLVFIKKQIKSHFSWNEGREILYMDGQLDERQRQDSISSFNDERSEAKVLLASLRACSEGINLVGASRVVLLDTVWNPSVEKQAISRAYRIGQKRVVYVYRLFTSGTEVRQYSQQAYKERISQLIFADVDDDGEIYRSDKSKMVREDKVLDAMAGIEGFGDIFEKIIHQPKESDLIQMFGLVDCN